MINEAVTKETIKCRHFYQRISWSAIFVGALIAVGLSFLLNLFSLAIGLSAFSLSDTGAMAVVMGGLIALIIGMIIIMFVSGYAAGYLGRFYCPERNLGIVYGFSTWVLALIFAAALAGPLSYYLANYVSNITSASVNMNVQNNRLLNNNAISVQTSPKGAGAGQNQQGASNMQNPQQKNVNINTNAGTAAWSAFSLFILFIIGAISCCIGGCWGMKCCPERTV